MKTIVSPWLLLNGTLFWRQILRMKGECGWIVWLKSSHNQWRMKTNKVGIHFLSSFSEESMTGSHSVFFSPLFFPAPPPSQKKTLKKLKQTGQATKELTVHPAHIFKRCLLVISYQTLSPPLNIEHSLSDDSCEGMYIKIVLLCTSFPLL